MSAKSYERLENETDRSWQAFQIFLSLGPGRTPGKTAIQLGVTRPVVNRWVKENNWRNRAAAYDQDNNPDTLFLSTPEASPETTEALPVPAEASPVSLAGKPRTNDHKVRTFEGNPWDRQPGEGDEAWEAFVIYRDIGVDRSIKIVEQRTGKSHAIIGRWSSAHKWVRRSAEWDKHIDQEQQKAIIQEKVDYVKLREQNLIKQEKLRAELLDVHLKRLKEFKNNPKENPYRLPSILTISESGRIDQESRSAITSDDEDAWAEIGLFRAMVRDELKGRNNEITPTKETIE